MSVFENWKPEDLPPQYEGKFDITDTGEEASYSCRTLWRVVCKQCGRQLHPRTTDPTSYIEYHQCGVANAAELH